MKVILIKDCKDGKVNQVIDVSAGYATNYLIKNKFAVAYNPANVKLLDLKLQNLAQIKQEKLQEANELKSKLEQIKPLVYVLSTTIDANGNLNVHGSVSQKHIIKDLISLGFEINKSQIEVHNIKTLGLHDVLINLHHDVIAKIIVKVESNDK